MNSTRPELTKFLEDFFESTVAARLKERGIVVHLAARNLFVLTVHAQIDAGIVSEKRAIAAVQAMARPGIADFYQMKFGNRTLSYNRMLRLLADMHDNWISVRNPPLSGVTGTS